MTARIQRSLALSCLLAISASAGGDPPAKPIVVDVSSGGVALGSYQGGFLLGRTLGETSDVRLAPRVLTGASAGAINTLGGLYYAFHPLQSSQTFSPYTEWLKIDWKDLATDLPAPVTSLLDTTAIAKALGRVADMILSTKPDHGAENAQVQFGFAITRFLPEVVNRDLGVQSAAEKIVVRLRWLEQCPDTAQKTGCYQAWTTGYGMASQSDRRSVNQLWFGELGTDQALIRQNLILLAKASSAFPFAFPPTKIQLYNWIDPKTDTSRSTARTHLGAHIDSIFQWRKEHIPVAVTKGSEGRGSMDSTLTSPLPRWNAKAGLAWGRCFEDLTSNAVHDTSCIVARSGDSLVGLRFKGSTLFFAAKIDSAHGRWPKGSPVKFSDGGRFENQPLELAMKILEDSGSVDFGSRSNISKIRIRMLSPMHYAMREAPPRIVRSMTSEWILALMGGPDPTSQELLSALERDNVDSIELNTTSLPLASEHVIHFSGFFEARFRRFDFLVGLLDALSSKGMDSTPETLRGALDSIRGLPDQAWIRATLGMDPRIRDIDSLFLRARRLSLRCQRAYSPHRPDRSSSMHAAKDLGLMIDTLQAAIRSLERNFGDTSTTIQQAADVLRVLMGSLRRLQGTFEAIADGEDEKAADRQANFNKGLSDAPGRSAAEQRSDINDVYTQAARFLGKDVMGLGNSFSYPAALHHARTGIGIMVGQKPRWAPPYARLESSNTGFCALQGFSLLPRRYAPFFPFDLLRWESGVHITWSAEDAQYWIPLRIGMEIPMAWDIIGLRNKISFFPSWTYSVPMADSSLNSRFGIDLLLFDLVHLRAEPHGFDEAPDVYAGIRTGFDPFVVAEGIFNGTNSQRIIREKRAP